MLMWIIIGLLNIIFGSASTWAVNAPVLPTYADTGVSIMTDGRVDHTMWDALLKRYVDQDGFVAYGPWKEADEPALDAYLAAIGKVEPERLRDRSEQLTFWINVYNALTIKGILHFYPTKSIRDHVGVIGYNIWKDFKITIHDRAYSLDEIEHKILRKMEEPRIHFAIVCASIGCPRLLNEAYTSERLEAQLTSNTRAFFADPDKFRIDRERRTVFLSPILDWFKKDFGKDRQERLAFIKPFLSDEKDQALLDEKGIKVKYLDYDWNINEQEKQ